MAARWGRCWGRWDSAFPAGPRTAELPNDPNGANDTNTALLYNGSAVFVSFASFESFGTSSRPWPLGNGGQPTRDYLRTIASISPYGSSVATKISLGLSRPNGARSTIRWCLLGNEKA